jgi:hypothetical protein
MSELATVQRGAKTLITEAEDRGLVIAARDAGFEDRQWRAMFYEKGPYDVTFPTLQMKRLAVILLERFTTAPATKLSNSPNEAAVYPNSSPSTTEGARPA